MTFVIFQRERAPHPPMSRASHHLNIRRGSSAYLTANARLTGEMVGEGPAPPPPPVPRQLNIAAD